MLTVPSFQEDPAPLVDMFAAYARSEGRIAARRARARSRRRESGRRARSARRARRRASAAVLGALLPRWTHAAIRFRERARLKQALLYSRCRRIALAMGDGARRRGTIVERDDVFFLTVAGARRADRRRRDVPRRCAADSSRRGGPSTRGSRRRRRRIRSRWRRASTSTTRPRSIDASDAAAVDAGRRPVRHERVRRSRHGSRDGARAT